MIITISTSCGRILKESIIKKLAPHQLGIATGVLARALVNNIPGYWRDDTVSLLGILLDRRFRAYAADYLDALRIVYLEKQNNRRSIALEEAKNILKTTETHSKLKYINRLNNTINSYSFFIRKINSKYLSVKNNLYLRKLLFSSDPVKGVYKIAELYRDKIKKYTTSLSKLNIYFDYYMFSYFTSNKLFKTIYDEMILLKNQFHKESSIRKIRLLETLLDITKNIDRMRKISISEIVNLIEKIDKVKPAVYIANISTYGEYSSVFRADTIFLFYKIFEYLRNYANNLNYAQLADSYLIALQSYLLIYYDEIIRILNKVSERKKTDLESIDSYAEKDSPCEELLTQLIQEVISGKHKDIVPEIIRSIIEADYNFVAKGYYKKATNLISQIKNTRKVNLTIAKELAEIHVEERREVELEKEEPKKAEEVPVELAEEVEQQETPKGQEIRDEKQSILEELTLEESVAPQSIAESSEQHEITRSNVPKETQTLYGYVIRESLKDDPYLKTTLVTKDNENFIIKQFIPKIITGELKNTFNGIIKHWHLVTEDSAPKLIEAVFEDRNKIYIVREYTQKTLKDVIKEGFKSLDDILDTFIEIAKILEIFHRSTLHPHGNLKPSNILVKGNNFLLSDFGQCEFKNQLSQDLSPGDLIYMAPEQMNQLTNRHTFATDIWQLGILLYEMITGKNPFEEYKTTKEIEKAIISGSLTYNDKIPTGIMKLIQEMCNPSKENRITLKEIIQRLYLL